MNEAVPQKIKIDKMPLELRALLDVSPSEQDCVFRLMGLTKILYMKYLDVRKFMVKHNFSSQAMKEMVDNILFSKKFFKIMDEDDAGGISIEELA